MKSQNPQPLPVGYRLENGYRIIGVLGNNCLLAEKHAPVCPAPYAVYVQLLKEEPVPANLDKIEQIRRNTDTIVRLMDYLT